MHVIVNGKETEIKDGASLEQLLDSLGISRTQKGIAVAVNNTVVPRETWRETSLQTGDAVEIIRAVQGG